VFHMDVAKIDQDVAHIAMVVHVCYKRPFQMFYLPFSDVCCKYVYFDVAYVSHICCKFYLDVLYVLQCPFPVFSRVFCKCFRRMF
jgi:hypothetical protein